LNLFKRIIAKLDIKGPDLVKGIHLEGLRVLGNPNFFAKEYYTDLVDELIYQDVVASLYQRNNILDIVNKTSKNIFIPLTVGGGIKSIDDIKMALKVGADKISMNTAAVKNPEIINNAANTFGSSTIVISIEASKNNKGEYMVFTDNGREETGKKVIDWAKEVFKRGAGEIILTSIDNEGTGSGFDNDFINKVSNKIDIQVIAHGGAGSKEDILDVFQKTKASAVALSSILHYSKLKKVKNIDKKKLVGNTEFLNNKIKSKNFENCNIKELKKFLKKKSINIIQQ
jgi:cyclase